MMEKNKKAPARSKAKAEYILTTKLFCGKCERQMTGISGTSKSKNMHYYYQCVGNRQKVCDKKTVQKEYIENLVIETTKNMLTNDAIKEIAKNVVKYAEKEKQNSDIPQIEKNIKGSKNSISNLLKSLEKGIATETILNRISELETELSDLEIQKAIEKTKIVEITTDEVEFFISKFKDGDITDIKYRKALIDTFVNRIYLYDDRLEIFYNSTPNTPSVTKYEHQKDENKNEKDPNTNEKCSYLGRMVGVVHPNTNTIYYLGSVFAIMIRL